RDAARLNSIKASMLEKRQQCRIQRQETVARFLQPPSKNQGFQYIYIPTKARVPVGQLRSRLRQLDINNGRILDIHYPTRNVVALLVHNNYASELKSHLQKFKIRTMGDFNPCDSSILMDPNYEHCSKEERDGFALMHHSDRVKKALAYIHVPVKAAVARYFYNQGWISKSILDESLPTKVTNAINVFNIDEDVAVLLLDREDTTSQL
ncbi:hypothetical protein BCV71DRAFT_177143, partial [Rhizopus microsporus]